MDELLKGTAALRPLLLSEFMEWAAIFRVVEPEENKKKQGPPRSSPRRPVIRRR